MTFRMLGSVFPGTPCVSGVVTRLTVDEAAVAGESTSPCRGRRRETLRRPVAVPVDADETRGPAPGPVQP